MPLILPLRFQGQPVYTAVPGSVGLHCMVTLCFKGRKKRKNNFEQTPPRPDQDSIVKLQPLPHHGHCQTPTMTHILIPRARQFATIKQPCLDTQLQEGETADLQVAPGVVFPKPPFSDAPCPRESVCPLLSEGKQSSLLRSVSSLSSALISCFRNLARIIKSGVVVHTCNICILVLEDLKFEASLSYLWGEKD